MNDNYNFSVGCIVRKKNQVLLVRHTYGGANGKLLIPGGFCHENELPEEAAVREVFEETSITAEVRRMLGIRCDRKTWYILLEMDYIDGVPASDGHENSEALFCELSEALTRSDCTEITKVILRKILNDSADYFYSDIQYKEHKGDNYTLYI
ncbi:MAG: NUDIX hydrolase [Lachnospiraceae bacterium]|nr:NUDIX hydrolase [Lachnospiraceae bacterium]